ncbi:MAG TPA: DEAD/DEAH box helicase family protein [Acidimicrobiales bacterium]|nr:DEAD/DEAH box helicase family protein [Acidimicrobiales bacterium]
MSTPFDFLKAEFPDLHEGAVKAGAAALSDPRTACFHARWTIEQAIQWAYKHDRTLAAPYDDGVSALLHDPAFKEVAGDKVFRLAKEAIRLGNQAAHKPQPMTHHESVAAVSHLFQFCFWFARTYCRGEKPPADLTFDPRSMPRPRPPQPSNTKEIQELQRALEENEQIRKRVQEELLDKARLEAELEQVRAEITEAKARAAATPDEHDYSETETRDFFIDLLLGEAGWKLDQARDREFEVTGMPNNQGTGYVDYVLWGDDGKPLAVVEAKKTKRDARVGQQQAKLYADCLEKTYGQRPVIFYSNGYEHWIWDDAFYPPRAVQGFYEKGELELLIQRRTTRVSLADTEINSSIVERYYQTRSIRRIGEAFERDHSRKALIVMATGAGKTRTVVALSDVLIRANWAKRILFLADRTALVNQATNVFKAFLPDSSPVNLVTDRHEEGRVYVSTYPTMLNLIHEVRDGKRRFGPGHFDLIVIDEAHRSVFQKYRAIFDYFDSLLVGLTATPRDEVDRSTYSLFDLEPGVPTDAYGLEEAVADGFLVPPKAVSVPLQFQLEGIRYDELSDEEKDAWDELDWDEDGGPPPNEVGAEAINRWLFNTDTVDKVLAHLMTHGLKVAGGDRLGKTIIFAKNQAHADFIADRFNANYPHYKGEFARVITHSTEYAQDLIDKFSIPERGPHIAISVDMLDTGIDVPEIVNLVFFKLVRSKTKFWQMIGRGTRLCPDLFGPGQDKAFFYIFDFCQNLEFFNQNPDASEGSLAPSLGAQLFVSRLDLIATLDASAEHPEERRSIAELLRTEVAAMPVENVVVRPHRRLVEKYAEPGTWETLDVGEASELARNVAGLPNSLDPEAEETKRFDLLLLRLQLALLRTEPAFPRLQQQVQGIAHLLEGYPTIPAVAKELDLIAEVQTREWWVDVTLPMLENLRRRLRLLVPFIEKGKRTIVYTDFTDTLGDGTEVELAGLRATGEFERFRRKTRHFLDHHKDHVAIQKLHRNRPITDTDIAELQRILVESGVGTEEDVTRAVEEAGSLGVFIRSLVGLDRSAAKEAFAEFLDDKRFAANQIEFVNLVIDHLTEHGFIEARRFYQSPFTDISPTGPDALFASDDVDRLLGVVHAIRNNAEVA